MKIETQVRIIQVLLLLVFCVQLAHLFVMDQTLRDWLFWGGGLLVLCTLGLAVLWWMDAMQEVIERDVQNLKAYSGFGSYNPDEVNASFLEAAEALRAFGAAASKADRKSNQKGE